MVKVSGQNCFRTLSGSLGQIRLGLPKGSAEGSTKVPPRFHQSSTKVPPKFHSKFRGVSGSVGQIRLGLPRGSAEGSPKVKPRFHQSSTPSFVVSLVLLGRSVLGVPRQVPPRFHVWPRFHFCLPNCSLGSANCSLHLSPSLVLGSKLYGLLTCLAHTPRCAENDPSCRCCWGILWGYFSVLHQDGRACSFFRAFANCPSSFRQPYLEHAF